MQGAGDAVRAWIEVEGLQDMMRKSDRWGDAFKKELAPATLKGATIIRDAAKGRIKRRSRGGHLKPGELASGITAKVTWDKNASKAFAGAEMDPAMNNRFVYFTKGGTRYYVPAAVEYGHAPPGGYAYTVLATNKKGEYIRYKKGPRKGQIKRAAAKKQPKAVKPRSYMKWAKNRYGKIAKAAVVRHLEHFLARA